MLIILLGLLVFWLAVILYAHEMLGWAMLAIAVIALMLIIGDVRQIVGYLIACTVIGLFYFSQRKREL